MRLWAVLKVLLALWVRIWPRRRMSTRGALHFGRSVNSLGAVRTSACRHAAFIQPTACLNTAKLLVLPAMQVMIRRTDGRLRPGNRLLPIPGYGYQAEQ